MFGAGISEDGSKIIDLSSTSVPRLLFTFLAQRFSGRVEMIQPGPQGGPRTILLRGGLPISCDWDVPSTRMGELLVEFGTATGAQVDAALQMQHGSGGRLGELLVQYGVVRPAALMATLREQCERRLVALFAARDGEALVTAHAVGGGQAPEANVLSIITRGVRAHYDPARVQEEMGQALRGVFTHTSSLLKYCDHFGFNEVEQAIVKRFLDAPEGLSCPELEAEGFEGAVVRRLMFTLSLSGMIESHVREAHHAQTEPPTEVDALANELQLKLDRRADASEVLALESNADARAIHRAAKALKRSLELAEVPDDAARRERMESLYAAIDKARDSALGRREALARLASSRALREGKYSRALPLLEELTESHPNEGELQAGLAWCRLEASTRRASDLLAALNIMDEVLRTTPDFGDAHYYRGRILVEQGSMNDAKMAFERALQIDPNRLDAERHIRALRAGVGAGVPKATRASYTPVFGIPLPKKKKPRHPYWSGSWPVIWILSGVVLLALVALQIILRLNMDF